MRYRVTHTTEFIYEARVGLCYNCLLYTSDAADDL